MNNWTEAQKLLVNKYQSAKLIGISHKDITGTEINGNVVTVTTSYGVEVLDLNQYKQVFVSNRKQRLEEINIDGKKGKTFAVNPKKQSVYQLTPVSTAIHCECVDYQNQVKAFGKGCCKHGYALLNSYGMTSLNELLQFNHQYKEYQERQTYLVA
jgi:hypothetical protein